MKKPKTKKLIVPLLMAMLISGSGNISADIFANAESEVNQYGTGCLMDSEDVLKEHLITDEQLYNLNLSDNDTNDYLVDIGKAAKIAALPSSVDLASQFPTPGNQGKEGSCTAWAVAYALKSHQEYVEHGWDFTEKTEYSPAYVYNQINDGEDKGSRISDALDLIVNEGVCSLYNMKYVAQDYLTQPNASQKDVASNFKGGYSWYTIEGVDEVKACLANGDGVVIQLQCYPDFDDISPSNPTYDVIREGETSRGGHAICLIGYDEANQRFKFINSWGPSWGIGGYGYISYDMFTTSSYTGGYGYILDDQSHSDSTKFFTDNPGVVQAKVGVRAYTSPDFFISSNNTNNYHHSISANTYIGIDKFVAAKDGVQPYFITEDGYYISAQKAQLKEFKSINNVLIRGDSINTGYSSQSETSTISFATSNVQYNNHNTMKIDYYMNQNDSYGGYAGALISGDATVSTDGATGFGFWYMTPAGQNGTIAFCMQGSVEKKIVSLPTTNGKWTYFYNDYSFLDSSISDVEIYINGNERDCITNPARGTLYIAEITPTNIREKFTVTTTADGNGKISGEGSYIKGTLVNLIATPNDGYKFIGWIKDGKIVGTDSTLNFTVEADTEVTAVFGISGINYYSLKAYATEGGSIPCSGEKFYPAGAGISLTAVADDGYKFVGWSYTENGDIALTSEYYISKISCDTTLYAHFVKDSTDSNIFIKGISNTASDWINANSGSDINISSGSGDYPFIDSNGISNPALKICYSIKNDDQYGGYAGRTVSLESTYQNKGSNNYDGIGFWYLTPSDFNGQIALCLQSQSAGLDDLIQLTATNGEWRYYFYETDKTNISDMTLYINGSKNGYTTTITSDNIASGKLYIANMSVTKQ